MGCGSSKGRAEAASPHVSDQLDHAVDHELATSPSPSPLSVSPSTAGGSSDGEAEEHTMVFRIDSLDSGRVTESSINVAALTNPETGEREKRRLRERWRRVRLPPPHPTSPHPTPSCQSTRPAAHAHWPRCAQVLRAHVPVDVRFYAGLSLVSSVSRPCRSRRLSCPSSTPPLCLSVSTTPMDVRSCARASAERLR